MKLEETNPNLFKLLLKANQFSRDRTSPIINVRKKHKYALTHFVLDTVG